MFKNYESWKKREVFKIKLYRKILLNFLYLKKERYNFL